MKNKKLLIITGERSGLESIIPAINKLDETLKKCITIVAPDYSSIREELRSNIYIPAINGLTLNTSIISLYLKTFSEINSYISEHHISDVILVDNPEFNMLLARALFHKGTNLYYFIIPQIWAWRRYRIRQLKRYFKKVFVIFPFEEDILKNYEIDAEFVGHPKYEQICSDINIEKIRKELGLKKRDKVISLFPGTRENVLKRHFALFEDTAYLLAEELPDYKIIISDINRKSLKIKKRILYSPISALSLIKISDFAIISSGSTTMEATFANVPFIGVYKPDLYTYFAGKLLLEIDTTIMPNILLNERFITELISPYLSHNDIVSATISILNNKERIQIIKRKLKNVSEMFKGFETSMILKENIESILTQPRNIG